MGMCVCVFMKVEGRERERDSISLFHCQRLFVFILGF